MSMHQSTKGDNVMPDQIRTEGAFMQRSLSILILHPLTWKHMTAYSICIYIYIKLPLPTDKSFTTSEKVYNKSLSLKYRNVL